MNESEYIQDYIDALKRQTPYDFNFRKNYYTNKNEAIPEASDRQSRGTILQEEVFGNGEKNKDARLCQTSLCSIKLMVETISDDEKRNGISYFASVYHNHDFFEMIYVYRGHCITTIEDKEVTIYENALCIYNLQAVHKIKVEDEDSVVINIMLRQELFHSIFDRLCVDSDDISGFFLNALYNIPTVTNYLLFSVTQDSATLFYLNRLFYEYIRQNALFENAMSINLQALFIELSRQYRHTLSQQNIRVTEMLSYISAHMSDITLPKMAEHFGYSQRNMIRLIREATSHTLRELVTDFRMNTARKILRASQTPIEEISLSLGYRDRSYFDKTFLKKYGITPAAYRRQI